MEQTKLNLGGATKENSAEQVAVAQEMPVTQSVADIDKEDLDAPYTDKRNITISLVHNYSTYRKVNMKVLGQRKEIIGSSITSCRLLSSNKDEVEAYFPALVGLSPNNPEFITRVKAWLSNIQVSVNENDKVLNTSFIYNHKRDYLRIKAEEEKIDEEYERVDRANLKAIKEAIKKRVEALNALESSKHKYGRPENLEEYLIYRHCLLYRDVAKDMVLINSDNSLRFYIKDENKEAAKRKKLTEERVRAMRNFVEVGASDSKFNSVFVSVIIYLGRQLATELLKSDDEKKAIVIQFVNEHPDKFNKIVNDKNVTIKAFIETLIARGELVRSEFNQQISTADGTFIGSNMNEAIAYFNNPNNKDVRTAYENKLKFF
jgi:hypothetical protein